MFEDVIISIRALKSVRALDRQFEQLEEGWHDFGHRLVETPPKAGQDVLDGQEIVGFKYVGRLRVMSNR